MSRFDHKLIRFDRFGKGSDGSFAAFEFFDEFPVSWSKNHHRSDRIE